MKNQSASIPMGMVFGKFYCPDCGERLVKHPRKRVVRSGNPDTLARDCAILKELGYTTDIVYPFDLFPRTGHVESVVCLTKGSC